MNQTSKFIKIFITILFTIILAVLAYQYFRQAIQDEVQLDFNNRTRLIKTYLNLLGSNVNSFKQDIEYLYQLESSDCTVLPAQYQLKNFDKNHYILSTDLAASLEVSLSGMGSADNARKYYGKEINTILKLSSRFNSIVKSLPEITWVYYTSINRFIFVAPVLSPKDYLFKKADYQRNFWREAEPGHNPEQKQIITRLYDDAAGQGLMITISSPVMLDKQFSGVISLDLGLEFLRSLLTSEFNSPLGEYLLVDESSFLVGKVDNFKIGTKIQLPDMPGDDQNIIYFQGKYWLITEVVDGQLWLVHTFAKNKLTWAAIIKSLPIWLILIITLILAFVLIKLQESHKHVLELSRVDPLTGLLNRRGLYEAIKQPINYCKRHHNGWSVVIMDIDYFKNVNDTYGHDVGDEVIEKIGHLISNMLRKSDIASRWGGEEFLLFLPDSNVKTACHIADKILKAVQKERITSKDIHITLSSGCAEAGENESFSDVLKRADKKLFEAKEQGRNQNVR